MEYAYQHTHTYILPFPYGQDIPHTWTIHSADMDKNCPTDTPPDYGLFSILFPHEERYKLLIHQGTLRYFSEKNPERPSGVRFFFEKFLAASSPKLKRSFRKKREKIGRAAQCGRHRKRLPSSGVLLHPLAGRRSPSKLRREWV